MSPSLGSKAKLCLLVATVASCFYGSSDVQGSVLTTLSNETPSVPATGVFEDFDISGFKELDDNDIEQSVKNLEEGIPVFTTDPELNLSGTLEEFWNIEGNSNTLNFAFFPTSGINIIQTINSNFEARPNSYVETIYRPLRLWMVAAGDGSSSFAFDLYQNPLLSPNAIVNFTKSVELNYLSHGNDSIAIRVGTESGQDYPLSVSFEETLNVNAEFDGTSGQILYVGPRAEVGLQGETKLFGSGQTSVTGVYLGTGSDGVNPRKAQLTINGNFIVSADYAIAGSGNVTVDYSGSEVHWAGLYGSLDQFTGTWKQTGGYLYVEGKMDYAQQKWDLNHVFLATNSSNVFSISMEDWYQRTTEVQVALIDTNLLSGLIFTDSRISFDYLEMASNLYKDIPILATGDVYIADNLFSLVSLDGFKKLTNSEKYANLVLTNLTLNLAGTSLLDGETIQVGAIQGDGESELTFTNSKITLYRTADSVTQKIPQINIGENASLSLYGANATPLADSEDAPTRYQVTIDSKVKIEAQGTMNLYGLVDIKGDITNEGGLLNLQGYDINFLANLTQNSGTTEVSESTHIQFTKDIQINGGELILKGTVNAITSSIQQTSGTVLFSGKAAFENYVMDGIGKSTLPVANLVAGANVYASNLTLTSASLTVGDGGSERAYLMTNKLSMGSNASLNVMNNGVLIFGDQNSVPIGSSYFYYKNIPEKLATYGLEQSAVLAINSQVDLGQLSNVTVGGTGISTLALDDSTTANIVLGEGSVLLIGAGLKDPVFTSSGESSSISLGEGSVLIVPNAFDLGTLTDGTVEVSDDYVGSKIITGSSYVDATLVKTDDGWKFVNTVDLEAVEEAKDTFIYPQLQNYLYTEYDGVSTDSENLGAQFLAKADNELFTLQSIKNKIIAQTTQVSRMLGAKLTAYESARKAGNYLSKELGDRFGMKEGEYSIYGGINYDFLLSRYMHSYLGGTGFRSNSQAVDIGMIYALDGTMRVGVAFGAATVDSKTRQSIVTASNRQWNFVIGAGLEKDIGPFKFGVDAGYMYSKNRIKGIVPASMQMARLTSDLPTRLFSVGVNAGVKPIDKMTVGIKPTLRIFFSGNESIKFGGKTAFESKSSRQTFLDLPLYFEFKGKVGRVGNADIELDTALDGAWRVGQRKEKVNLSIQGLSPTEKLKLDYFGKWNAGIQFGASALTKRSKTSINVGARTGGDAKVGATAMLETRWSF